MGNRKHDIERYLRGEMTSAEMHAFENEALHDPFLAEALEGAGHAGTSFLFDLKEIQRSVHHRTRSRRPKIISMWSWSLGIAAGLVLVAVCGVYVISLINHDRQQLAANKPVQKNGPAEAKPPIPADTTLLQVDPAAESPQSPEQAADAVSTADDGGETAVERTQPAEAADPSPVTATAHEEVVEKETLRIVEADLAESPVIARDSAIAVPSNAGATARGYVASIPHTISGKVVSATDGKGLPGVNVVVKGTKIGTLTDAEGYYDLDVERQGRQLVFSFIGMKDVEVAVAERQEINVSMDEDLSQLSEVVITGAARAADYPTLELAEPEGGKNAFRRYLSEEMKYPTQALEHKVEGRVTIEFTVGPDGKLGNFTVLDGLGYGCDDEVIRLIKQGPTWSPSKRNAQPVQDKVKVRLKFKIPDK